MKKGEKGLRCKNLPEEKKQKLCEHVKKYYLAYKK